MPYVNTSSGSGQTTKPVTVRSVKRRDRSKSVERERRQRQEGEVVALGLVNVERAAESGRKVTSCTDSKTSNFKKNLLVLHGASAPPS